MNCWTGDIILKARKGDSGAWQPMHSFLSDDVRRLEYGVDTITVSYRGNSENRGGFRDLAIEEKLSFVEFLQRLLHAGESLPKPSPAEIAARRPSDQKAET